MVGGVQLFGSLGIYNKKSTGTAPLEFSDFVIGNSPPEYTDILLPLFISRVPPLILEIMTFAKNCHR